MCGADLLLHTVEVPVEGSPPRVRSRLRTGYKASRRVGITSACAEQTVPDEVNVDANQDHLRVCGADNSRVSRGVSNLGSPPRVRSRRHRRTFWPPLPGITSACAEQTVALALEPAFVGDHLRVCGADRVNLPVGFPPSGSPPRVRSRLGDFKHSDIAVRITSACAEQTEYTALKTRIDRDHLRVCGADSCILLCSEPAEWRGIFDLRTA